MSTTIAHVTAYLEDLAPVALAEEWDNVGLLVGDSAATAKRVMTCLTLTPSTVAEALERKADLVVVHHPLPFRPLTRLTTDTVAGRLLWDLVGARIAVYSAHTAFDSAREGINQQLAEGLGLRDVKPLVPRDASADHANLGNGRAGNLKPPIPLATLAERASKLLSLEHVRVVGQVERPIGRVAVACGSGGSFLESAMNGGCHSMITGEASFHTCLEAEALGISLVLTGHYASERFAMDQLASHLAARFTDVEVWASVQERDPIHSV